MPVRHIASALIFLMIAIGIPAAAATEPGLAPIFGLGPPATPPPLDFTYRGWRVDARPAAHAQAPQKTVRLIRAQLDIVDAAGLSPGILATMRATPIVVVTGTGPQAASYNRGRGVAAFARRLDRTRPVLLTALLAAYFDRALPAPASADIGRFRRDVLQRRVWPKSAAMLRDDQDFFALTAAAYLHGDITREPYNRANLRKTQPDYYDWLSKLFDGGRPRT